MDEGAVTTRNRRGPSRADVARLAGVSPPTVSLVLNGNADQVRLAKATQERVLEAARTLRYIPNSAARAMRGMRHLTVGIIARPPGAPATLHVSAFEDFIVGVIERAASHAHNVKFLPPVVTDSYDVVATLKDAQVDGIVVHNLAWIVRTLVEWHVPVVYVGLGEEPEDLPLDRVGAVTIDETAGLRAAAQHLLDQGHVHVGVITGPHHRPGPLPRLQGFVEELQVHPPRVVAVTRLDAPDWSPESGYQTMRALLDQESGVTAIHAGNDWMAAGVLRAIHEAGLRVPDDIAVVGFGDFRVSGYLNPPLTTVRWPLTDLGMRAVDMLLAQLNVVPQPPVDVDGIGSSVLPAELVVRASTHDPTGGWAA